MSTEKELFVIFTTAPEADIAEKIARTLVEERLAACVQIIGPIKSLYRWDEKLTEDKEFLILIKAPKDTFEKLERRLREIHPYEVPEIVAISAEKTSRDYLEWAFSQVG
jgi:periplasmic divalent cation tolerance protein